MTKLAPFVCGNLSADMTVAQWQGASRILSLPSAGFFVNGGVGSSVRDVMGLEPP